MLIGYLLRPSNGMCYFCEIFVHPPYARSVKTIDKGTLYVEIVSRMKIYSLTFHVLLFICINIFSTLAHCVVKFFYFQIKICKLVC